VTRPFRRHPRIALGLSAQGLDADLRGYGAQGTKSGLREVLARVKAVGDGAIGSHVLLGPRIPIGGDGRTSWGPPPPPGTPPAGASAPASIPQEG
jgi:SanA protein